MKCKFLLAVPLMALALNAHAGGGVGAIFGAVIGGVVGSTVGKSVGQSMSVDDALLKAVDQVNKKLPMTVDRDTRWDSTEAGPGLRFTYNYTIVTVLAAEVDAVGFYQEISSRLRSSVCGSPDMQVFFKHGVTVSYSYRGNDGLHISKVDIAPRDCGIS